MISVKEVSYRIFAYWWVFRTSINGVISKFDSIPWPLRLVLIANIMLGLILICTALIPGAGMTIGKVDYTHKQLWADGYAYACFVAGFVMIVLGTGIYMRKRWSRLLLVMLPIFQYLPFYVAGRWSSYQIGANLLAELLSPLLWVILWMLYLVVSKNAKQYYSGIVSKQSVPNTNPDKPTK